MGKVISIFSKSADNDQRTMALNDDDYLDSADISDEPTRQERAIAETPGGTAEIASAIADYRVGLQVRQFAILDQMFDLLVGTDAPLSVKEQAAQLYQEACMEMSV